MAQTLRLVTCTVFGDRRLSARRRAALCRWLNSMSDEQGVNLEVCGTAVSVTQASSQSVSQSVERIRRT